MDKYNPWRQLSHDTYEKHMGHENVRQLEMLSRIFGNQLSLIAHIKNPIIVILGITGGNGLDNIEVGQCKSVIGIDINEEYLNICHERYSHLPELELHRIDLMTEKERVIDLLKQADLITANLLIRHIHLSNFMDIVGSLTKPVVSVTIQFDPDGRSLSHSGCESAFDDIQKYGRNYDESDLTVAMSDAGYAVIGRDEYILPNEKVFVRLDYKRQDVI